jgi:hypothetical protein
MTDIRDVLASYLVSAEAMECAALTILTVELRRAYDKMVELEDDRDAAWLEAMRLASWLRTIPEGHGPYHG